MVRLCCVSDRMCMRSADWQTPHSMQSPGARAYLVQNILLLFYSWKNEKEEEGRKEWVPLVMWRLDCSLRRFGFSLICESFCGYVFSGNSVCIMQCRTCSRTNSHVCASLLKSSLLCSFKCPTCVTETCERMWSGHSEEYWKFNILTNRTGLDLIKYIQSSRWGHQIAWLKWLLHRLQFPVIKLNKSLMGVNQMIISGSRLDCGDCSKRLLGSHAPNLSEL